MVGAQDGGTSAGGPAVAGGASATARPQVTPASSRSRARRLVRRTAGNAWDDDIFSESAAAAFWQTLSLPPLLLGLFGALGYVGGVYGPGTVTAVQLWIVDLAGRVFNQDALDQIIIPTVADILTTARGEVVSVGFLLSFWSGSSAMASFVDAITRAHGQYELRNLVWQRILAMLLYLVGLATGILLLPLVALGPARLTGILPASWEAAGEFVLGTLYYPVIGVTLMLALTTLYKIALPLKPPWYRGLPGAVLAAVVFLVGVTGLRAYLDWVTGTGYTYGALAAPIAFLLATFFIGFSIILGAHLNAAVQAVWPVPLRDRRGRSADRDRAESPDRHPAVDVVHAVRHDPEAAAAALEGLDYVVTRPVPTGATRHRAG